MNFNKWFKSFYIAKGFVSSKDELQEAWNEAIDEAVKVAEQNYWDSVLKGPHVTANKIKELKE